jgi:hypothetical protein
MSLADEYWTFFHSTQQMFNIDRGDIEEIEHWDDLSPEGLAGEVQRLLSFADRAETLAVGQTGEKRLARSRDCVQCSFDCGRTAVGA